MRNRLKITQCVWDTLQFAWTCPFYSRWQWKSQVKSYEPESTFIDFLSIFDACGHVYVIRGLYVHVRDTPDAKRSLSVTSSRVVLSAILARIRIEAPVTCGNSEMCVRARSLVMELLTQTGFLTSDVTCDPWKWTNTMSETGIEPLRARTGEKLISVDRKTTATMVTTFPTLYFVTYGSLL